MIRIIRENKGFFACFAIFVVAGAWYIFEYPKGHDVLLLNRLHGGFIDYIFRFLTYLGDGYAYVVFILLLLFFRFYYALIALVSSIGGGLLGQLAKRIFFPDQPRPKLYFKDLKDLSFLDGVEVHSYFSFPSGHTITAFTIFLLIALMVNNKRLGMLFFCGAFLTGISRIYLVQHFFMDVYAGAIIGTMVTLLVYYIFHKFINVDKNPWLNRRLYRRTKAVE